MVRNVIGYKIEKRVNNKLETLCFEIMITQTVDGKLYTTPFDWYYTMPEAEGKLNLLLNK